MKGLNIAEILDLIRGSAIIHTRAYNAKKPMHPESNFAQLYELVRKLAEKNITDPIPVNPLGIGQRNASVERLYKHAWQERLRKTPGVNRPNLVEPPWFPTGTRVRVLLKSLAHTSCIGVGKQEKKEIGNNPAVVHGFECSASGRVPMKASWAWQQTPDNTAGGFLRPWTLTPKKILCLDGQPEAVYGRRFPSTMAIALVGCVPDRPAQRWGVLRNRIVNMASKLCLTSVTTPNGEHEVQVHTANCSEAPEQDFAVERIDEYVGEWGTLQTQ